MAAKKRQKTREKRMSPLMTTAEVARVLGLSRIWVWTLIQNKKITAERAGRFWLVRPDAVRKYLRDTEEAHRKAQAKKKEKRDA